MFMNNRKKLEEDFVKTLNNHYYNDLNINLQKFITFVFNYFNHKSKIYCEKLTSKQKADFLIKIDNTVKYVSLKSGSQNSVHSEKIETFISFLLDVGINESIINILLLYHYGDDTLTGNGKTRYSANESKLRYKNKIFKFNKFINYSTILKKIVERFLLVGAKETNKYVDVIYYGDIEIGTWCSSKELLEFCIYHKSMYINTPHFSVLTYQNWCRNITFSKKSESHRNYIQIKWFSILSDIRKIRQINDSKIDS